MNFRCALAVIVFGVSLAADVAALRAATISQVVFTDMGTYGVGGAPWEGAAIAQASFNITFDPDQVYSVQPLDSIITDLAYSVTDPRFTPASLTFDPIVSFEYAYGTLTLYSDSVLKKVLAGTANITIGINGWTNPNPGSSVWYSQVRFTDTLTTSGGASISDVAAVPLPATLPLFAGGLGLMGWMTSRRRGRIKASKRT